MSTSEQLSALHTDILELLDVDSGGRYDTTILNRRINLAQGRLHALLSGLGWSDWLTWVVGVEVRPTQESGIMSIPLPSYPNAAGAAAKAWWKHGVESGDSTWSPATANTDADPPGVFKVLQVRILESYTSAAAAAPWSKLTTWDGRSRQLHEARPEDHWRDITARDWTYSDPPRYRLMAKNLIAFDRKSAADAAFLIEYVASIETLSTSDYIMLQPVWAQYIVADVVANLAERDRDFDLVASQRGLLQQYTQEIREEARARSKGRKSMRDDQSHDETLGHQEFRDRLTFGRWAYGYYD